MPNINIETIIKDCFLKRELVGLIGAGISYFLYFFLFS